MLEVVVEVQGPPSCPLMVSCRDGSTSTGLLLAAYKLWLDLGDPSCRSLALLPTVAALRSPLLPQVPRRQRMGMVGQPRAYLLLAHCLG